VQTSRPERVSFVAARRRLAELANRVAYGRERIILTRHGRPVAAVVPLVDLRRLDDLDDERAEIAARAAGIPTGEAVARRMEEELRAMP
jgi:prevent-host-death family protein